jgi:hypothetical protein
LTFTATATDPDIPANTLSFSLDEGAPAGAAIHSTTGVFTWTPTSAQAPGRLFRHHHRQRQRRSPSLNASETVEITVRSPDSLASSPSMSLPSGTVTIIWNSQVDRQYRLEFKDSIQATAWTTAADYTATAITTSGTHTTSGSPQRLYRVRQLD